MTTSSQERDCGFCGKWIDDMGCQNISNIMRSDGTFWSICDKCLVKKPKGFEESE